MNYKFIQNLPDDNDQEKKTVNIDAKNKKQAFTMMYTNIPKFDNEKMNMLHKAVCDKIHRTYIDKSRLYGNAAMELYYNEGEAIWRTLLSFKIKRYLYLSRHSLEENKYESKMDTLLDLANYAIMAYSALCYDKEVNKFKIFKEDLSKSIMYTRNVLTYAKKMENTFENFPDWEEEYSRSVDELGLARSINKYVEDNIAMIRAYLGLEKGDLDKSRLIIKESVDNIASITVGNEAMINYVLECEFKAEDIDKMIDKLHENAIEAECSACNILDEFEKADLKDSNNEDDE